MTTKPTLAFQPAPRPQSRVSAEEHQQLQEATRDLGFGRALSAPLAKPEEALAEHPAATSSVKGPKVQAEGANPVTTTLPRRAPALKFDVPDEVWDELRMTAIKRRVTVKFLVLEALASKGYNIDLEAIPEDGRRLR